MKNRKTILGLLLCTSVVCLGLFPFLSEPKTLDVGFEVPAAQRQRGLSWVGSRPIGPEQLAPAQAVGANWLVQTPFGWQDTLTSPKVRLATTGHLWGETDEGLITTHSLGQKAGFKVLLKPHIWLHDAPPGTWCSDIRMTSEADWGLWWADYRAFLLHYAQLARDHDMEALCIGTELLGTVDREKEWRSLIAEVRTIFPGKLVYAANWYKEFEAVPFWDALDWIGIQAYFPLSEKANPTTKELIAGWQPHLQAIAKVAKTHGKPVVFTEIGYRADGNAAKEPWIWPKRGEKATTEGLDTQVRCYEAFFEAVWPQPWVAGAYIWKWHPHRTGETSAMGSDFSPQGKPAEAVLRRFYTVDPSR